MAYRSVHHDIERQMRAAEQRRRRTAVSASLIGGAFTVGLALLAWGLFTPAKESSRPAAKAMAPISSPAVEATTPPAEPAPAPAQPAKKLAGAEREAPATKKPPAKTAPSVQRFAIGIGDLGYEPTVVTAKAGVPIELTVAQGDGCAAGFLIAELGISADNSTRDATVSLPALSPGIYRFTCGMDMVEGRLVVQ